MIEKMISKNHHNIVALVGMMGCGKTTIGRILAPMMGLEFIDIDQYIKSQHGMGISQIFAHKGEAYFRAVEEETTINFMRIGHVLSLGGGAYMNKNIRIMLQEKSVTSVYIRTDIDILWQRLQHNHHDRPLLKQDNAKEILENLLTERQEIYQQCDVIVDSRHNDDKNQMAQKIIDSLP